MPAIVNRKNDKDNEMKEAVKRAHIIKRSVI